MQNRKARLWNVGLFAAVALAGLGQVGALAGSGTPGVRGRETSGTAAKPDAKLLRSAARVALSYEQIQKHYDALMQVAMSERFRPALAKDGKFSDWYQRASQAFAEALKTQSDLVAMLSLDNQGDQLAAINTKAIDGLEEALTQQGEFTIELLNILNNGNAPTDADYPKTFGGQPAAMKAMGEIGRVRAAFEDGSM